MFTLTSDNGKEFARHQEIATALQADFYFAHPDKDVSMVMNKLNNRPRKCLGFKTPNQVFFSIKPSVALAD